MNHVTLNAGNGAHLFTDALDVALLAGGPHAHPQDEEVEDDHGEQTHQVDITDKIHPEV
jgi:hypothetical protein